MPFVYLFDKTDSVDADEIIHALVSSISQDKIVDRETVINDLEKREQTDDCDKCRIGNVVVHAVRTDGVNNICIAAGIFNGCADVVVLWKECTEHTLDVLSRISKVFERADSEGADAAQAVAMLKEKLR